jgi:hypothetical protein
MYYNNKLVNSTDKPKTTWSIIKTVTNNKKNSNNVSMMEIDGRITTHHQTIAEEFSNVFGNGNVIIIKIYNHLPTAIKINN